jgi:hypothetical protein
MSEYDIARRGPGKFRSFWPRSHRPAPSPVTVRFTEPAPKSPPDEARRLRASVAGLSGWELERIDRRI